MPISAHLQDDLPEPSSLENVDEEIAARVESQRAVAQIDDELDRRRRFTSS